MVFLCHPGEVPERASVLAMATQLSGKDQGYEEPSALQDAGSAQGQAPVPPLPSPVSLNTVQNLVLLCTCREAHSILPLQGSSAGPDPAPPRTSTSSLHGIGKSKGLSYAPFISCVS